MRRYLSHLRYVFRPEDALGKSHNLLSINAFKAQGVDFEYENKWVALVGNKVVAAGESVKEVKQKAEQAGYTDFMFHLVPSSSVLLAPYRRIA